MRSLGRGWRTAAIGGILVTLFAVGIGVAGAQPGDPEGQRPPRGEGPRHDGAGPMVGAFVTTLAGKLGIDEEALRTAMRETRDEMRPLLRERVAEAREQFRERRGGDEGMPGFGQRGGPEDEGPRFRRGGPDGGPGAMGLRPGAAPFGPRGGGPEGGPLGVAAEIIGIDAQALRDEMRSGKSLAQVIQESGRSPDTVADQIVSRIQENHGDQLREQVRRMMDLTPRGPRDE